MGKDKELDGVALSELIWDLQKKITKAEEVLTKRGVRLLKSFLNNMRLSKDFNYRSKVTTNGLNLYIDVDSRRDSSFVHALDDQDVLKKLGEIPGVEIMGLTRLPNDQIMRRHIFFYASCLNHEE